MAGDTIITIVGNLTADPELRFIQSGAAVADFTVASTPRTFDRNSGEWKDGDTLFMRCSIWREAAENVAETLRKGMRVIVQGRLIQRSYETRDGQQRTVVEMQVDEVGPSLRYAKAQVEKTGRGNFGGGQGGQQSGGFGGGAPQGAPQQGYGQQAPQQGGQGFSQGNYDAPQGGTPGDPWSTNQGGGGATNFGQSEPPF